MRDYSLIKTSLKNNSSFQNMTYLSPTSVY